MILFAISVCVYRARDSAGRQRDKRPRVRKVLARESRDSRTGRRLDSCAACKDTDPDGQSDSWQAIRYTDVIDRTTREVLQRAVVSEGRIRPSVSDPSLAGSRFVHRFALRAAFPPPDRSADGGGAAPLNKRLSH